ncbi:MAG: polysaccharide deacetylase family protein [Trueperaceae bacterium]
MNQKLTGAFVVSLDFELHWGVRDQFPLQGAYTANLQGARTAVPKMLRLFEQFDIAATWATVGFLFARSKEELLSFYPLVKPDYTDKKYDPYQEVIGNNEQDDPLHYAPSLIEQIKNTPKQEISTHTFSHYYCLEAGQTAEAFRDDLHSAIAIAKAWTIDIRSIIFPRNQVNPDYVKILLESGVTIYRDNEPSWFYSAAATNEHSLPKRAGRLLDTYVPLTSHSLGEWDKIKLSNGLYNIPSSRFLRPYSPKLASLEALRLHRICQGITRAAQEKKIYHLWWHPHNMGLQQEENLGFLKKILEHVTKCREAYGLESLSMLDVVNKLTPTPNHTS